MKKNNSKEVLINVNMTVEKVAEIDGLAKEMSVSRSAFIRLSCNEMIQLQKLKQRALGIAI